MNNTVFVNQSFFDKVIETTGDLENAFEVAILNEVSITDKLLVGSVIKAETITNSVVAGYFDELTKAATELNNEQAYALDNIGIGEMIVEYDFIVN